MVRDIRDIPRAERSVPGAGSGITRTVVNRCQPCTAFFARFTCANSMKKFGIMECDCPKCQGYCECNQA